MKRTRLERRTRLAPGKPLERGGPITRVTQLRTDRPRPRARADPDPDWAEVREVVWQRSGGRCEKTGVRLDPNDWHAHHRLLRSRGGRDEVANAVALSRDAHTAAPDAVHRRVADAEAAGWIVKTGTDPAAVPVQHHTRGTVWLTTDGGYSTTQPEHLIEGEAA